MCNICLKSNENLKCSTCTFEACNKCICGWYKLTLEKEVPYNCPQCKNIKTFDIDYTKFANLQSIAREVKMVFYIFFKIGYILEVIVIGEITDFDIGALDDVF